LGKIGTHHMRARGILFYSVAIFLVEILVRPLHFYFIKQYMLQNRTKNANIFLLNK